MMLGGLIVVNHPLHRTAHIVFNARLLRTRLNVAIVTRIVYLYALVLSALSDSGHNSAQRSFDLWCNTGQPSA